MSGWNDDAERSLAEIARRQGRPIVPLLLAVQESREVQWKHLRYVKHLECLSPDESHGRKQT